MKKKIFIIIIVVILVSLLFFIQYKKSNFANENTIPEIEIAKESSGEITEQNEIVENIIEDTKNIISENNYTETEENTQTTSIQKETVTNSNSNSNKQQTNKTTTTQTTQNIERPKQTQIEETQKQESTHTITKEETIQKQEIKQEETQVVPQEKYVRNDTMIAKIKSIIESNATEDMKTYGYTIVIDSSIKGLTNQFTFTENRVKSAICNKFGTIRIYAEDYYSGGQLIMTQCYII